MDTQLTITEIKDNQAFLKDEKNNIFKWPISQLPKNQKVGDILYFSINRNQAKDILNEILNP